MDEALHLGIVIRLASPDPILFATSDQALQRAAQRRGLAWYDPEKDVSG